MTLLPDDPVSAYLATLHVTLKRIRREEIATVGALWAEALERGGIIHAFGTGHSGLLAQEVFYRAGGLVAVNPILDPRLGFERGAIESTTFERSITAAEELARQANFQRGDAGCVISNSGRNALPVEMALRMRHAGMKVVALTNLEQSRAAASRHPSGLRLFEVADAVLDNCCPVGDAAIRVPGIEAPMGPLSTIVGAALLHASFIDAAHRLAERKKPPAVFVSANVNQGEIQNLERLLAPYRERIRFYRSSAAETPTKS